MSGSKRGAQSGRTNTQLASSTAIPVYSAQWRAQLHRASIVYEIEQYRQKTVQTLQNTACNLDAQIPTGVSQVEPVFCFYSTADIRDSISTAEPLLRLQ